jgi:ABC-type transport system involved in Fe-S cluster assembly fused permease/ATPase subunit
MCATAQPQSDNAVEMPAIDRGEARRSRRHHRAGGAGKSTLLALAGRFYEPAPDGGTIRLDGRTVRTIDRSTLRRTAALVPQRAVLFAGTILSNLTYTPQGR